MRRPLAAAIAVLGLGALTVPAPAALGPRYGGTLTLSLAGLPAPAEAWKGSHPAARTLAAAVHEGLLRVDGDGLPRPGLAKGWGVAAGGREWTLRLDGRATFHDGTRVTAADVVRSLRRFLRGPSPAAVAFARAVDGGAEARRAGTADMPGITASGEDGVVVRLLEGGGLPMAALAAPAAAVVSPAGAGAGPFRPLPERQVAGLALGAFGRHVRGRPFLDEVHLLHPEASPPDDSGGAPRVTLLVLVEPRGPFADLDARRAVLAALDGAELLRLLPGAQPAPGPLPPGLLPPLGPRLPGRGGPLPGQVALTVSPDVPAIVSQRVVAILGSRGTRVSVTVAEPGPRARPGRRPGGAAGALALALWAPEVAEAELALRELAALGPTDPDLVSLLDEAARERDADRRRSVLYRAEEALRARAVVAPLARLGLGPALRPGLHGAEATPTGALVLEDAWTEP